MRLLLFAFLSLTLAACAGGPSRQMASPEIATTIDPFILQSAKPLVTDANYRIGPSDKLSIRVFQVPDLSLEQAVVDSTGNLQMPLIGSVRAAGLTPAELSVEMERLLGARYLRNPRVNVIVTEAASEKVTVDGAVTRPGVYEMRGRTTLLQAVTMASGPVREADLRSVAVFRSTDQGRMIAVFDLAAIRGGQAADPVLMGDDVVVVDTSRLASVYRDLIALLPGVAVFAYL